MTSIWASIIRGSAVARSTSFSQVANDHLCKYADDTYPIVSATNFDTSFTISRQPPTTSPSISVRARKYFSLIKEDLILAHRTCLVDLGACRILKLQDSLSQTVSSFHHIMCRHCMHENSASACLCDKAIQEIFRCSVSAKFLTLPHGGASQNPRIDKFSRRCTRSGFCSTNLPSFHDLGWIVICSMKYSHIPATICTTMSCSLLFHPFHRQIHSDLEHMTRFFLNTAHG